MLLPYSRWLFHRILLNKSPIQVFADNIYFSYFISFTDFWGTRKGIHKAEIHLVKQCFTLLSSKCSWIAVDVGANVGLFSLLMAQVGFNEIYAFEPIPKTFGRLTQNLALNPNLQYKIRSHQLGIGQTQGKMYFHENIQSHQQSKIATCKVNNRNIKSHLIEVTSLDSFFCSSENFPNDLHIGLLKIDIEGFEVKALQGCKKLFQRNRIAFIYTEIVPKALEEADSSIEELTNLLRSYNFFPVSLDHKSSTFRECTIEDAIEWADSSRNILFANRDILK